MCNQRLFRQLLEVPYCGKHVAFCGIGNGDEFEIYSEEYGNEISQYGYTVRINYCSPPVLLFVLDKVIPKNIANRIETSFKLYFSDANSCGNVIRTAIELILDERKIKKYRITNKHKRMAISLHERIQIFGSITKYSETAKYLLAIKWIGNQGSHTGTNLKEEHILDAYNLLNKVLDDLYCKKFHALNKLRNKIIKQKGV